MFSRRLFFSELDWYRLACGESATEITHRTTATPDALRTLGVWLTRFSQLGLGLAAQRRLSRLLVRHLIDRQQVDAFTVMLCATLGEPAHAMRSEARDWFFYRALGHASWSSGRRIRQPLDFPRKAAVEDYLRQESRGILITSIHMGNYLQVLTSLADALRHKTVYLLRRKAVSAEERSTFRQFTDAGMCFEILRHEDRPVRKAIAALRHGQVVVAMHDLSARWGATQPIRFCGRQLHWVKGPAQMALAGNAVTLPIYSHFDTAGVLQVRVRRPQSAARSAAADRPAYVRQQTKRLAAFAEAEIRRHPAQWHHWRLLHEMACATFSAPSADPDPAPATPPEAVPDACPPTTF